MSLGRAGRTRAGTSITTAMVTRFWYSIGMLRVAAKPVTAKPTVELDESRTPGFVRHAMDHRVMVLLVAYVAGVLVDRLCNVPLSVWLAVICVGISWWCFGRSRPVVSLAVFLISIGSAAGFWHQLRWRYYPAQELGFAARETTESVCVRGRVADFARLVEAAPPSPLDTMPREARTRFRLHCERIRDANRWQSVTGTAEVTVTGHCRGIRAGDRVELLARLVKPSAAMNPSAFDFRYYERAHRRLFRLLVEHPDCLQLRGRAAILDVRWHPQNLRGWCQRVLFGYLPRPQAELACAMLLGARDYLSKPRREAFFVTGTIHLLAISGLHVGILAGVFFFVMRRTNLCSDRTLLIVIAVLTLAYAIITEGKPPVLRASVMVWIVCLARAFHRDGFALNSLSAAALLILVISPAQLFQVGFHLSFLAVIALLWLAPLLVPQHRTDPLTKLIDKSRPWWDRQLRITGRRVLYWCAASLSIWCLTLPVSAHQFHLISPIGLVLNVFLWIPVAIALLSGFGTLLVGWIPPLARMTGWVCASSFGCLESVVQWSQAIPGSHQWVAGPSKTVIGFFYVSLSLVLISKLLRKYSLAWLGVTSVLSLAIHWPYTKSVDELRCTFLSVGHGTCVVVEMPDGGVWLYDAGSIGGPDFVVDAVSEYLWSRRIRRLEAIVVSHADVDHFNGVPELLRRFDVAKVFVSPTMFSVTEGMVSVLRESIAGSPVSLETVSAGMRLALRSDDPAGSGPVMQVMHPPLAGVNGSDNANSIVLCIDYRGRKILLTGDIEFPGLDRLLQLGNIDVDVVMAPHHGSLRSEPVRFAAWCQPEWVIISSGRQGNLDAVCRLYDGPSTRTLHTARDGAVTVVIDATGLNVSGANTPPTAAAVGL